ncbi:MAG: 2-oxoacid:acceptor oxidoreductase subunit alpha, partial [Desulfopila sp.]|nr:2-oxoacid:acceptor oxidoreductase subunit alpha [Desulfopila sp.]
LNADGARYNTMRLRSFPFPEEAIDFINTHDVVFIIEQNRDSQMRQLLINECHFSPEKLVPVLCFDGLPITSSHILQSLDTWLQTSTDTLNQSHPRQGGSK